MQCVADASALVPSFVKNSLTQYSDAILASLKQPSHRVYVPEFFYIETTNALLKYVRANQYELKAALEDIALIGKLGLTPLETSTLMNPSIRLAIQFNLSAYDAAYVSIAQLYVLPLYTTDDRLIHKLAGSSVDVRHLKSFPLD